MKPGIAYLSMALCLVIPGLAPAQSSSVRVIRFDANGAPQVQQQAQSVSVIKPAGSVLTSSSAVVNPSGQTVVSRDSTATTTQPAADVTRSESTTQVRDKNGTVRAQTKTTMTETRVNSDTVQTETVFQESRPNSSELITAARMKETRKETSDGTEYQRVIESRAANGEFRPKQKVEAVTQKFSDGSSKTHSVESAIDLNGNVRPSQDTTEKQWTGIWGKEMIERIIKKAEANGELKLDRVEIEETSPQATSGVVKEKVVKQPDSAYGLSDVQRVTTTMENPSGGAPYKLIVTREFPRNDRTSTIITQVEIERTRRRWDGTTYIERELKTRDVNGDLSTVSVTQIENKESKPGFSASGVIRTAR